MRGMCAFPDRPQAIQRRDTQRGSEVTIGSAAARGFFQLDTEFGVTWRHEADQIRDRFLGVLSHELRTPVTSILQRLSNGFSEANCRSR